MENFEEKKLKHRSPSFPAIGLKQAINKVTALYKADGLSGTTRLAALKHIGYSGENGASKVAISALMKFNLVSEANGRIIFTEVGKNIMVLPDTDLRKKEFIRKAALSPSIYKELYDKYKSNGLPSDASIVAELILDYKFSDKAAKNIVSNLKETFEFAEININEDELSESEKDSPESNTNTENEKSTVVIEAKRDNMRSFLIPRKGGKQASLQLEGPVTEEDLKYINTYLTTFKDIIIDNE